MASTKKQMVRLAAQLYTLGLEVERNRDQLRRLVEKQVPYDSPTMIAALRRFNEAKDQWDALEQQYLHLRDQHRS